MIKKIGNIFDHKDALKCITTNGIIKKNGELVMGAGIAREAARRYPELPIIFARHIEEHGNTVCVVPKLNIASFPTKHHWRDKSDIELIKRSCYQLIDAAYSNWYETTILPKPGCSNGGLSWPYVESVISNILTSDDFIVMDLYEI